MLGAVVPIKVGAAVIVALRWLELGVQMEKSALIPSKKWSDMSC